MKQLFPVLTKYNEVILNREIAALLGSEEQLMGGREHRSNKK